MKKIDRIIGIIKENMVANAPGTGGGFSASADAAGPVAGNDSLVGITSSYVGKRGKIDYRKVPSTYKSWVKNISNK